MQLILCKYKVNFFEFTVANRARNDDFMTIEVKKQLKRPSNRDYKADFGHKKAALNKPMFPQALTIFAYNPGFFI
jgi:hypothetical protein